ncbi:hypothetical protein OAJ57_00055 [Alphaproteobacteria bacterium]|nr:hypothetical protein [Alphaproteobacteria bacterium]
MAVFGSPVSNKNDEYRAVRETIGMITGLWEWNDEHDKHCIEMNLGLNSNSVVSSNTGPYKRMC